MRQPGEGVPKGEPSDRATYPGAEVDAEGLGVQRTLQRGPKLLRSLFNDCFIFVGPEEAQGD